MGSWGNGGGKELVICIGLDKSTRRWNQLESFRDTIVCVRIANINEMDYIRINSNLYHTMYFSINNSIIMILIEY